MLKIKWRIIQWKIRQVAKTKGKLDDNLCKEALIGGKETCNGEDLLTEYMNICKKLNKQRVTKGGTRNKGKKQSGGKMTKKYEQD